jgi:hypothetical protein
MSATVLDSFVVLLGLDPTQFDKVANEQEKRAKNEKDAALKRGTEIEGSAKKQRAAFNALKGELLGLLTVFTAGKAVKDFVRDTINGDAAIGRLSRNIGVSAQDISAWQGVIRGAGGSSEDASKDLSLLASAAQEISLTGQSRLIPYLNLLHVSLSDLQDPSGTLLKIADAFSRMDPRQAAELGREMGFSPATVSTLERGRDAVASMLAEQRKLAPVTEANTRAAEELQRNIADLTTESGGFGRELLGNVAPALLTLLRGMIAAGKDPTFREGMEAAGFALQATGSVAQLTLDLIGGLVRGVARLLSGDWAGAWDTARKTVSDAARDIGGFINQLVQAAVRMWDVLRGHSPSQQPTVTHPAAQPRQAPSAARGAAPAPNQAEGFRRVSAALQARGISATDAEGIAAGIGAETRFDPAAFNGTGGGHGAYGLGQWRGARLRELLRRYGPNPTEAQQLDYLVWELRGGDSGGRSVLGSSSSEAALRAYVNNFMRPGAAGAAGDMRRGLAALSQYGGQGVTLAQTTVTIGRVDVHTAATDARGIAQGITPALRDAIPQSNVGTS